MDQENTNFVLLLVSAFYRLDCRGRLAFVWRRVKLVSVRFLLDEVFKNLTHVAFP